MTGIKRRLGSLLGPQGLPGQDGEDGKDGDRGLPGVNAVPADEAVATYVSSPETQTRAALINATTQKVIHGGTVPQPVRAPVLTVERVWPTTETPYTPVWANGNEIYAYGEDKSLRKTVDGGRLWSIRGYNATGNSPYDCFLKLHTGTLIQVVGSVTAFIQRSVDDGKTWTRVHDWRTDTNPLGAQSWCVNPETGHIFYGEYNKKAQETINVYRSTDDGESWHIIGTWPGSLAPQGAPNRITHVHAVQWDPYMKRVVICVGDGTPATGLWRTTEDGEGVEPFLTNDMLPQSQFDVPRAIGIMPFPDYLVWATDATPNCYLNRVARSEIGKPNPVVEQVYRLNSTAWWSVKASDDGSKWVFSASHESNQRIDNLTHLYAVEDQGATVWEVGSVAANMSQGATSIQPLGTPDQGEDFWMTGRLMNNNTVYKMRLGYGTTSLPPDPERETVLVPQTVSGGRMELSGGDEQVFGVTMSGAFARRLYIMEMSNGEIDNGGSVGTTQLQVRRTDTGEVLFSWGGESYRYSKREDFGKTVLNHLLDTGGRRIEFVLRNINPSVTKIAAPTVTFGWGRA